MLFRIIKIATKLLGMALLVEVAREKMGTIVGNLQDNFKRQAKHILSMCFLIGLAFIFLGLALRFALHGLACWINTMLASNYLGFFLVATFCFVILVFIVMIIRKKMLPVEEADK